MVKKHFEYTRRAIKKAQNEFDSYQKAYFKARSSEFFCLELCGEAGELANFEKKHWKGKDIPIERLEDEAADVLIALMNYCNAKNIDLSKSLLNKLRKIEKRRKELKAKKEDY
jgi:NTP pyrophosphatase (non-canonical NTP hydrolase)